MRKLFFTMIAFAAMFAACSKENSTPVEEPVLIPKTFSVVSPETKTLLDGVSVKWSAGDEICVIAATTGNKYTFEIDPADAGKASATFTGSIAAADAAETTFYAVYPNQTIRTVTAETIEFDSRLNNENPIQTAVAGSFDPAYSVMVATSDANGVFAFSHRSAFLKITVGNDNVSAINIKTSSTRFYGRPVVPIADSDMAYNSGKYNIQGAVDNVTLGGTLTKGSTYYIPVPIKNSKVGTLTLTYSFDNGTPDKSISTTSWTNNYLSVGKIYDLGAPVIDLSSEIIAANVTIEDTDESGVINFTVSNMVSSGVASYSVTTDGLGNADWKAISYDNATGIGSISFECDANTDTSAPKTATVHIVYKDGSDNVLDEIDVTVTQKKKPSATLTRYTWVAPSSATLTQGTDYTWESDTAGQTISYSVGSSDAIITVNEVSVIKMNGSSNYGATSKRRVFTYVAPCAGTLKIMGFQYSSNDGTMNVKLDGEAVTASGSQSSFNSTSTLCTCEYEITAAGTVEFYTTGKSYFRSVEFAF